MTVYVTKVWGFDEPVGPLQFSTRGWRDRAIEIMADGDWVVLVGTKGENTDEHMKGRVLGIMEPTKQKANWFDFDLEARDVDYDEDGEYRWPFTLINNRAWVIEEPIPFEEVSGRHFGQTAASGIVALTEEEAMKILSLRRREAELVRLSPTGQGKLGDGRKSKNAPPPSTTVRRGVMHMRRAPASTYVMRLTNGDGLAFKIGWAFDVSRRAREFNKAAMPWIGGIQYTPVWHQRWNSARQAFRAEQEMLRRLDAYRTEHNIEVVSGVSDEYIKNTWYESLMVVQKGVKKNRQS